MSSEYLRLEALHEVAYFDQPVTVESPRLRLSAQSAVLRIELGQHEFEQVKAVYHEPGA